MHSQRSMLEQNLSRVKIVVPSGHLPPTALFDIRILILKQAMVLIIYVSIVSKSWAGFEHGILPV